MKNKTFGIQLKQCLLWALVSNFNLVKVGYNTLLPLAVLAFKVVHCLLLYIILYIRYTSVQSYGLGGHSMA